MANYYGQGRSNYFAVKDAKAFEAEMSELQVEVITRKQEDGSFLYGIMDKNQDGAGLEWQKYDHETEDFVDIDYVEVISKHLVDGSVAILMETGSEKYRYFVGAAIAFNNKGEVERISLEDIYKIAEEKLGNNVTRAEY